MRLHGRLQEYRPSPPPLDNKTKVFLLYWGLFATFSLYGGLFAKFFSFWGPFHQVLDMFCYDFALKMTKNNDKL